MWPYVIDARDIINNSVPVSSSSGIYAWYRRLSVDSTTEDNFLKSIEAIVSNATWPIMEGGKGKIGPYETEMHLRPFSRPLSASKRNIAEGIAHNARTRAAVAQLVLQASVLQPPLYVGKAVRIDNRITDHLRGESKFVRSLGEDFAPSQMVLAYLETNGLPSETHALLEAIVGTAAIPRYAERTG